jgi:sulfur carrier protein ThiS
MWLRLHPPFGEGKEWEEIDLPAPASVKDLLDRLKITHPKLKPYIRESEGETFHHFILIRGDHILNADDLIQPTDRIVIMMPLTGG